MHGESELDNSPEQIEYCISKGYDAEIDLWCIGDLLSLGHDCPKYNITKDFLEKYSENLWIHCKNLHALTYCSGTNLNYFWHEEDVFTLTSKGYIWTYPSEYNMKHNNSKQILLDFSESPKINQNCYGICLDYV